MMSAVSDSSEVNMQDLKIYIVISDPNSNQDVSIKGSFEMLRAFLSGVGNLEIHSESFPAHIDSLTITKRKPTKKAAVIQPT